MFLSKPQQSAKSKVLQQIIDMMNEEKGKGLKKPGIAAISIEAKPEDDKSEGSPLEEASESPAEEKSEDGGDNDDELLKRLMAEYAKVK